MTHAHTTPPEPVPARWLHPVTSTDTPAPAGPGRDALADLTRQAAARVAKVRQWLPPTDPALFDCYLGQLAHQLDPHTEADPVGVMATLLAAAGVHLGPGPHFPIGYERHPLLTWPLIIGPTGSGKKGTSYNAAKALLLSADNEFVASNVRSGLSSGEGLAAVFAVDNDEAAGKGRNRPRLLPEGDCRLLAYEPEWASVMARMKRDGNTLSATLRAAWEGGDMSTLNVDARVARQSHVGIVAHITPEEFVAKVSASDMAGGTYNRFLPVAVAQSKFLSNPTTADPALLRDLGASLAERLTTGAQFGEIGFTPDGLMMWDWLYLHFGDDAEHTGNPALAQFTSRAAPNCLRIAATYAALDRTDRVTTRHLAAAAAFVRYSIASAAAVLQPNDVLGRLADWITAAGPDGRTRRDVTAEFFRGNAKRDGHDPAALLAQLTSAGRITRTERPRAGGGGRATEVFTAATLTNLTN